MSFENSIITVRTSSGLKAGFVAAHSVFQARYQHVALISIFLLFKSGADVESDAVTHFIFVSLSAGGFPRKCRGRQRCQRDTDYEIFHIRRDKSGAE